MNKKVLKRKLNFIKDPIFNYYKKGNHRRVNRYAKYYDSLNIKKNTIIYESRDGNSMTDSPYAMFKYMLNHPDFKDYQHIWSIADFDALSSIIRDYEGMPNVKFVKRNSKEYLKCLASCEYLINNSTFQSFFIPKKEQIYINTWHGTPLKSMGFDIPGNPSHSQNVLRNFLSTQYILSPNEHTTRVFTDSYKLKGLYKGEIIEEGYPRIDATINMDPDKYNKYLRSLGLQLEDNKENILYAPTWKGSNVSKVNNDVLQINADLNYLDQIVGDKFNILVKVHPYLYKEASKNVELSTKLIPDFVDTNELLSTVDLLVTDYSSIFFDFLVTDRPILFYMWDSDAYSEERGQYLSNDELPGPILLNIRELAEAISNIKSLQNSYKKNYEAMKQKFVNHDDGKVTERVIQYIFKNQNQLNVIKDLDAKKQKILIYPGGMRDNGITSSFINLMNNIDYDKFDVSCFTGTPHTKEVLNNISKVNKNVRFLFKPGLPVYKIFEIYEDKFVHNRGATGFLGKRLFPFKAYIREHERLFGRSKFDYIIDFSGYSLYWAKYLIVADAKKKICYMHNDLLSESKKVINKKRPHLINLRGLFSIYNRFDKLVSVSKGTMELNRKNLAKYADYDKFDYILNSINPDKILQVETKEEIEKGNDLITAPFKSRAIIRKFDKFPVWNTLPNQKNAKQFNLDKEYNQAEVLITRVAKVDGYIYYKFSYNNQMVGWIKGRALKILPDSIIKEEDIDKIGMVVRTKGNHIWSMPYKFKDMKKVSTSNDYKNIIVSIDKEVTTQHGIYCRISINTVVIGWIDISALKMMDEYTFTDSMSKLKRIVISKQRQRLIRKNYKRHQKFIEHIEDRTLEERNISHEMYARISYVDNHIIWTKAYPNVDAKIVANAAEYQGEIARIRTIRKTRKGTYYEFYINENKIGWLNFRAFEVIKDQPSIIKESDVRKIAELILGNKDYIWTEPYGLPGAKKVSKDVEEINGKMVEVIKEVTTQKGMYCYLILNGNALGWVNSRSLKVKEELGIQVGDMFIPEPQEDNINFVNMGRLSPEKGQDNLIHAFAIFHSKHRNSKLYILGKGVLYEQLSELIAELGLKDSVHLMGQMENPFSFIKKCDCFVLSSHYEGQPMVLLEAMTLEMKIVATDIVANRAVLEDGKYGLLVKNSISGLVEGMEKITNEKDSYVPQKFNYIKYNQEAMNSFYKCL
ncbi:CDP-glycerol glycerophosphotransferase family protein [Niallia alba]|uniref:CDP-glycerol glycerophosphotransferase family protein n=1 Tax=Niallia alba TaxID=2729105 RepID=UPI002E1F3D0C|nr:CDP-glycerol glycerophosphotransferase family protein [Niallia alba]